MSLLPAHITELLDEECYRWLTQSNIIFIKVLNKLGHPVAGDFKGKAPKMNQEKTRKLFSQLRLDAIMRRGFDHQTGELDYTISKRKNMTVISVPIIDYLVVVAVKNEEDAKEVAERIIIKFGKVLS